MSNDVQITFDCADPAALAAFWAEVLDYERQAPPEGFDTWEAALAAFGVPESEWNSRDAIVPKDGDGPRLFFQQVPEGKTAKNRVHLDIRVVPGLEGDERMAALEAEADRLGALGATRAYRVDPAPPMEVGFLTMHDPEGNEFCLD
ncbi:VOC family protein [Aeromicrobium chenweiae]|uniref:Glyoxalase n=1 Tax=Aeromicrobium chenweiae TaxID=2079793 RepID=A0A2S0WKD8_9ACTN|nr:VOC family protein [Aeromicrobium chenweiae]AWB91806.1 glyoxalase [Aeromicrobium chenweiae]TGN32650.1 VOC family protein [Aeromicrobium chenweiae]